MTGRVYVPPDIANVPPPPFPATRVRPDLRYKLQLEDGADTRFYNFDAPPEPYYHALPFRSKVHRLQRSTSNPIINQSIQSDNLATIKTLVPERQDWKHTYHRYHLNDGYAVQDQSLTVVESKDESKPTTVGTHISSSGQVIFSFRDRQVAQLDAEDLLRILQDRPSRGKSTSWNIYALDEEFRRRWGRNGIWHTKKLELCVFLSCFEQTFHVFGDQHQFVRCRQNNGKIKAKMDRVMINLARCTKPLLIQMQNYRLTNTRSIKGYDLPDTAYHNFAVDLQLKQPVPFQCFSSEEAEKFGGLRQEPFPREEVGV
ncbi:unnamed protein product [Amoebophrya sp. A120]|nr:unnamed protein product [Amoebophrya sp. A120]|eukprot:GSA120T00009015001.1